MNLIEDICEEAFDSKFHLAQFVEVRLFAPAQPSVDEILITRVAQDLFACACKTIEQLMLRTRIHSFGSEHEFLECRPEQHNR